MFGQSNYDFSKYLHMNLAIIYFPIYLMFMKCTSKYYCYYY